MEDFFRELEESLRGEVTEAELADSMNYYRQYFREQQAEGRSEAEILQSLGSPRLIARSIIDAHEAQEENIQGEYYSGSQDSRYGSGQDGYYDAEQGRYSYDSMEERSQGYVRKKGNMLWGILILILVLIIVGAVIKVLLPVILVVIAAVLILRLIRGDS